MGDSKSNSEIRFAIVCDDQYIVESLSRTLQSAKGFEPDGRRPCSAWDDASRDWSDVGLVLIDSRIGRQRALELTRRITADSAHPHVVILGVEDDHHGAVAEWAESGAISYVPKDASLADFINISRRAGAGHSYCSPRAAFEMFERLSALAKQNSVSGWIRSVQLTTRQLDILQMLSEGLDNGEIAARLFLSAVTVKNHVHRILSKLGVRNRMEAVACWADLSSAS